MHKLIPSVAQSRKRLSEILAVRPAANRLPAPHNGSNRGEDILRDLVGIASVTGDFDANHQALDYIERYLRKRGMHVERLVWNGVESLVATVRRAKTPVVYLMGHVDVSPADRSFFALSEQDGTYRGRGVLDMKGAVAAYLGAVDELKASLRDYDFGIMIVTDEETGGQNGAIKLAEAGYLPQAMVVPDGGDANWSIERSAKGMWHIGIEATGRSAHGSRPWEGENAVDKLLAVVSDMRRLFPNPSPETDTMNIGVIRGGHATNQIPAQATVNIDLRFVTKKSQTTIMRRITAICKQYGVILTTQAFGEVVVTDPTDPYIAAYAASTEKVLGHPATWVSSKAANDTRWFAPYGVRCIVAYPRGGGHHGPDEWLAIESLDQMQRIFLDYLQNVAYAPTKKTGQRHVLSR